MPENNTPDSSIPEAGTSSAKGGIAEKLDAIGWALFFVWVGLALLFDFGWGAGLLGIGVITLGEQTARRYFRLRIERFWIVVGLLFLLGGLVEIFEAQLPLLPLLLIAAGLVVLFSAFGGKHITKRFSK
jgi:hypothetical protein